MGLRKQSLFLVLLTPLALAANAKASPVRWPSEVAHEHFVLKPTTTILSLREKLKSLEAGEQISEIALEGSKEIESFEREARIYFQLSAADVNDTPERVTLEECRKVMVDLVSHEEIPGFLAYSYDMEPKALFYGKDVSDPHQAFGASYSKYLVEKSDSALSLKDEKGHVLATSSKTQGASDEKDEDKTKDGPLLSQHILARTDGNALEAVGHFEFSVHADGQTSLPTCHLDTQFYTEGNVFLGTAANEASPTTPSGGSGGCSTKESSLLLILWSMLAVVGNRTLRCRDTRNAGGAK